MIGLPEKFHLLTPPPRIWTFVLTTLPQIVISPDLLTTVPPCCSILLHHLRGGIIFSTWDELWDKRLIYSGLTSGRNGTEILRLTTLTHKSYKLPPNSHIPWLPDHSASLLPKFAYATWEEDKKQSLLVEEMSHSLIFWDVQTRNTNLDKFETINLKWQKWQCHHDSLGYTWKVSTVIFSSEQLSRLQKERS